LGDALDGLETVAALEDKRLDTEFHSCSAQLRREHAERLLPLI
jgi:hypothetical protein